MWAEGGVGVTISVRGLVVMIVACQVMDPGSIPGERNVFFCSVVLEGRGARSACALLESKGAQPSSWTNVHRCRFLRLTRDKLLSEAPDEECKLPD